MQDMSEEMYDRIRKAEMLKCKNRFYFSYGQQDLEHHCYVWDGLRWIEYTEWCDIPGCECNWEGAQLVYATDDDNPRIMTDGSIDMPY